MKLRRQRTKYEEVSDMNLDFLKHLFADMPKESVPAAAISAIAIAAFGAISKLYGSAAEELTKS